MAKLVYLIEVDPAHLGPLGFVAGILQAQGVPQGGILADMLQRVQQVEVPDDWGIQPDEGVAQQGPEDGEEEFPEITPENDPTAPENLGIDLGDGPPEVAGEWYPQSTAADFGAGADPGV